MPFKFSVVPPAAPGGTYVAVLTILPGGITVDEWPQYEASYRALYEQYPVFVLVFDVRELGIPALQVIRNKIALMQSMKHRTVLQISTVVIITQYEIIKQLVETLMKAGGQAATYAITTNPADAIDYVANSAQAYSGNLVTAWSTARAATSPRFGNTDHAALVGLVLMRFIIFMRHFVRYAVKQKHGAIRKTL
jgi:hypothetical protein